MVFVASAFRRKDQTASHRPGVYCPRKQGADGLHESPSPLDTAGIWTGVHVIPRLRATRSAGYRPADVSGGSLLATSAATSLDPRLRDRCFGGRTGSYLARAPRHGLTHRAHRSRTRDHTADGRSVLRSCPTRPRIRCDWSAAHRLGWTG